MHYPRKIAYDHLLEGYRPKMPEIKQVIYNGDCTVINWQDGTKTVVHRQECQPYSQHAALLWAFAKKAYGSTTAALEQLSPWLDEEALQCELVGWICKNALLRDMVKK